MKHVKVMAVILVVAICASANYEADGGLFRWGRKRQCKPNIQKPMEVPFPLDEIPGINDGPAPVPDDCPDGQCPTVEPSTWAPAINGLELRVQALEALVKVQCNQSIQLSQTDISIIVGEVLKKMPPSVASYQIVPRNFN